MTDIREDYLRELLKFIDEKNLYYMKHFMKTVIDKEEDKIMKFQEKLPLPLEKISDDLKEMGVEAIVTGTQVEYDERNIGTDVVLTLQVRIDDIYKERKTPEQQYDDAMSIL